MESNAQATNFRQNSTWQKKNRPYCITAQIPADLVTFTQEIPNEKLHFLCSASCNGQMMQRIRRVSLD